MTPHVLNLVLKQVRAIRADLSDVKGALGLVELNLAVLGQRVGALTGAVNQGGCELDGLRQRIERRLELRES